MSALKWLKSFETGCEPVDRPHRQLMITLNEMDANFNQDDGLETLNVCHQFRTQLKAHFSDEEDLLRDSGFDRLDDHIASHQKTQDTINQIFSNCGEACTHNGTGSCVKEMGIVLLEHFVRGDLDFKSHLQMRNLATEDGAED